MRKNFLLRTCILIVALAAVLAVIIFTMSSQKRDETGTQTFFEQFVISGGPIVWLVLLPLSFITVYLIFEYWLTISRAKLVPSGISRKVAEVVQQSGLRPLPAKMADSNDLVSVAVCKAVDYCKGDWLQMQKAVFNSLQEQAEQLLRRIEWLNLIGNVSPMVGLFGTVFGMIKLFNAIVVAGGQPQPAHMADGISVALVTTFWGLLIAIPALAIHGIFRNRIESILGLAVGEAEKVLAEIKLNLKKQAEQQKNKQYQIKSLSPNKIDESVSL